MERQDWNRRHAERVRAGGLLEPNRFVVEEAGRLTAGRAIDLGCGRGRHAIWLAEHGWRVTAVDFSDFGISFAREAAGDLDIDWVDADLRLYEPERDAFDLVLYAFVQLPADERRAVLGKAAAAVAPGGTLLAVLHDLRNLTEGEGGPQDPSVLATPDDVAAELPGLEVERAETLRRDPQVDCVVRARR